ncbi:glutamate 5-kinase [Sinorhizobium medicae]|nr:glutamate 5-kinase [Sinorhizobium medicae]
MFAGKLESARRLVVKIGSALIANVETGEVRTPWLENFIEDVVRCVARGQQVIIVTSGAVALGSPNSTRREKCLRTEEKQTAAAIGQVRLMVAYEQALKRRGMGMGQVLLANEDIEDQNRRLNVRSTLQQLLKSGVVPVVNENDTTATTETCLGDNDRLAAWVAELVSAEFLILLSSVDGLSTEDPHVNPLARLVTEVRCITPEIEAMAGHALTRYSTGGMVTKLAAARIVMDAGGTMVIARGNKPYPLAAIENGGPSTWFLPR